MATLHEWVQSLFPDVPPKLEENAIDQKYYFKNSFTGSIAICECRKNEVYFNFQDCFTSLLTKMLLDHSGK